jgi:hypothetical protein
MLAAGAVSVASWFQISVEVRLILTVNPGANE